MDMLINGLLRVSRIGHAAIKLDQVEMNQLLDDVLRSAAYQIEKAGAQVRLEKPLAGCVADRNQLSLAFGNLLDNALKYRDPNRPLEITISSKIEGDRVVYAVADTGVGIASDQIEKIWEIFRRFNADEAIQGEGLGLTLVRRIIERMDGKIAVESTPGEGSRFLIRLWRGEGV